MANFILKKTLPLNPNDSGDSGAFSYLQIANQVWMSTSSQIFLSSDFGVSFNAVYEPAGATDFREIYLYELNGNVYAIAIYSEPNFGSHMDVLKWDGAFFNIIFNVVGNLNVGSMFRIVPANGKIYFNTIFVNEIYQQDGDTVTLVNSFGGGDMGGIVGFGGALYYEHSTSPNSTVYRWDGVSNSVQFNHGNFELFSEFYEFSGNMYYYQGDTKQIGTINITTGAKVVIYNLPEGGSISIGARAIFRERSGELNMLVGKRSVPTGGGTDGVRDYTFDGITFSKTFEDVNGFLGDALIADQQIVFGNADNKFFESECTVSYNGYTKTNENALNADNGTITQDVDVSNAIGLVEYRLLDDNEIEVVTWQVAALFENLAPGNYLLEVRDTKCQLRFNETVSILEFQSAPEEQQPARSRDYLNTPNFTRFYQIYGMTLSDFQNFDGDLPPPVDEVINGIIDDTPLRVTTSGDQRVTSDGDRRRTS